MQQICDCNFRRWISLVAQISHNSSYRAFFLSLHKRARTCEKRILSFSSSCALIIHISTMSSSSSIHSQQVHEHASKHAYCNDRQGTWHIHHAALPCRASDAQLTVAVEPPTLDTALWHDGARVASPQGDGDDRETWQGHLEGARQGRRGRLMRRW